MQYQIDSNDLKTLGDISAEMISNFSNNETTDYGLIANRVRASAPTGVFAMQEDDARAILNVIRKLLTVRNDLTDEFKDRLEHLKYVLMHPVDKKGEFYAV